MVRKLKKVGEIRPVVFEVTELHLDRLLKKFVLTRIKKMYGKTPQLIIGCSSGGDDFVILLESDKTVERKKGKCAIAASSKSAVNKFYKQVLRGQ